MIVVDASLLVAAAVDSGPEGQWAETMLASAEAAAPHLVLAETANVLRRLEARGRLGRLEATAAHRELCESPLRLYAFEPFAARVWELRGSVTSYDAWYVAVAEALDAPLATLDRRLAAAPGPTCRFETPR